MNVTAAQGLVRCLKAEGVPWVACYPTNHVNNALGEEGVPIKMMGEERFAVAIADEKLLVTDNLRFGSQYGRFATCRLITGSALAGVYSPTSPSWTSR